MPEFVPGLALSRAFYHEQVAPILDARFPDLRYCEALIDRIGDDRLRRAAESALIGSVDQFSDNTDLREAVYLREKIARLYD